jgi:Flp pilus assembly protein TadD
MQLHDKNTAARLLVALWMCGAAAGTCWAESRKPTKFRVSGAFCGTAWSGVSPQYAWLHKDSEISLMRPGKDAVVARASTDSSGRFQFSNVPRGTYLVGLVGFLDTNEMVEITSADQRGCAQPLIVMLYLQPFEGSGQQSRIVAKLPPNFANATGEESKERAAAFSEMSEGLRSDHNLDVEERHFRAAIQIDPTYWPAHVNLALALMKRKQFSEAEAEFREGVRVGGNMEVPYWQLTSFLVDRGRDADAETALNQARKDGLSSAGIDASFGLLAFRKHRWKEAESELRAAYEYTPEALSGFRHWQQWDALLIVALRRQGKSREADARYRSMGVRGDDPWVLNMIGWDMVDRGDHLKDAVRLLEKGLADEPDNAEILDSLGWANVKLKRFAIAESQLKQAAERRPDDSDVLEHLGELYAATGRADAARSMFAAALEHATDAEQRKRLSGRLKQLK